MRPDARDAVIPALDTEVRRGDTVEVDQARRVKVTIDGRTTYQWVTAPTVDEALNQMSLGTRRLKLSASRHSRLPLDGAALSMRTEKQVALRADGHTVTVQTFATTVEELLAEQNLKVDADDRTVPARTEPLVSGAQSVVVQRILVRPATETVTIAAKVTTRTDDTMTVGQKKTLSTGQDGKERQVVRYVYTDGKLTTRQVVSKTVLAVAKPTVVARGTKRVAAAATSTAIPSSAGGLNWAALARCESGGRASVVSANGMYHGLYQFSVSTWQSLGGSGVPSQASAAEQTAMAAKLYARSGAGQWPVCGSHLFD